MISETRLFVGRLAPTVQKKHLEDLFGRYGPISNISVKTTYGFVEFEDPRDARDAARELDRHNLEGSKIAVEFSHGRRSDRGESEFRSSRDYDRDRRDDRDRERDRDRDRDRERDRDRDRDRDYDRRDRDRERDRDRDYDRDRDRDRERDRDRDRDDRSRRHSNRGRYSPPYNTEFRVTVTGLPQGCSWQDLKDHFRQIGEVCFADVRRDRDGKETGIVEFKRLDDMREALRKSHSKFRGNYITVTSEYDSKSRSRSRSGSRPRRSLKRSRSPRDSPNQSRSPKRSSPSPKRSRSPKRSSPSPPGRSRSPSPKSSKSPPRRSSKSPSPPRSAPAPERHSPEPSLPTSDQHSE